MNTARLLGSLLAVATLAACGGSSPPPPAQPTPTPVLDFGLVSGAGPTRTTRTYANPLAMEATLAAASGEGPFSFDPSDLPRTVPAGGAVVVGIVFTPPGPGAAEGHLEARFTAGAQSMIDRVDLQAVAETVRVTVLTPTVPFGDVTVGDAATADLRFINDSAVSTVVFTAVSFPAGPFAFAGSPLPLTVAPGAVATVPLLFAPTASGVFGGPLLLGAGEPGGPVAATLSGTGVEPDPGAETVVDLGTVTLDGSGVTPVLQVTVPADAISVTFEGRMTSANEIGLHTLTGPGGQVYENASSTGPYFWSPWQEVLAAQIPNSDRSAVQLVAGGGVYQVQFRRASGGGSTMTCRAVLETRPGGNQAAPAVLDLNVWLAQGLAPSAATAGSDAFLQNVLSAVDGIFAAQDVTIGDVDYYDITNPAFDSVTGSEFPQLLATTSSASEARLNLMFVVTAFGGGVLGVAGAIPGTSLKGTSQSGVMVDYDFFGTNPSDSSAVVGIAETAAHEMGHYLGLYHTVEQSGQHDFIDDTPNCPASGTNGTCPTPGGGLLMHWQAVGGATITDGQGLVMRGHPHMRPGTTTMRLPQSASDAMAVWLALYSPPRPDGWCATCASEAKAR
jgi:hypothetical protein